MISRSARCKERSPRGGDGPGVKRGSIVLGTHIAHGSRPHRSRGGALLKALLLVPVVLSVFAVGWFVYVEHRRQYWDDKVRELCAKDGAPIVLQTVSIASPRDMPATPDERYADVGTKYVSRWKVVVLRAADPKVTRTEITIIRRLDQAVLGHQTLYARIGGDAIPADHPSSRSCGDFGVKPVDRLVFIVEGDTR